MLNELKEKLEELTRLEEIANHAEADYEREPENAEYEKAFDQAYRNEFNAFIAVSEMVVKMTGGRVDAKTARTLVRTKRNEIINLVA